VAIDRKTIQAMLALVLVQVLFGFNFVSSKQVVGYFSPMTFASLRFLISGITLYIFVVVKEQKYYPRITGLKIWARILFLSIVGIAMSQSLFLWGLKHSTATNTAILSTSIPMFTLLIAWLSGHSKPSMQESLGFSISLIGLLIFNNIEKFSMGDGTAQGDVAILLGCCLMAVYISVCKDVFAQISVLWGTTLMFLIGGMVLIPSAIQDINSLTEIPSEMVLWSLVYSIFAATLVTYYINNWAYKYLSPSIMSLFVYLQPLAAAAAAYQVFGETLTARKIFSAALIFCGMLLAIRATYSTNEPRPAARNANN
jgi:drug/metabolite transporter (DMT)-like permease